VVEVITVVVVIMEVAIMAEATAIILIHMVLTIITHTIILMEVLILPATRSVADQA